MRVLLPLQADQFTITKTATQQPMKYVWLVIATLAVLTQVPSMIESHSFNKCVDVYFEGFSDPEKSLRHLIDDAVKHCNGG